MDNLNMIAKIYQNNVRLGSEKVKDTNMYRVVIIRHGKRVYGSKLYSTMSDLNKGWLKALKYEYNKLNNSVTK